MFRLFHVHSDEKEKDRRWKMFCEKVIDCDIIEKRGKQRMVELVQRYIKMFPDEEHGYVDAKNSFCLT